MTREGLIKHWDAIKAFKEGKEIEVLDQNLNWQKNEFPMFGFDYEYRIKPEYEPELIPFDYSDAELMIGKVVINKMSEVLWIIIAVDLNSVLIGDQIYIYEEILHKFRFLDGSPCGKKSL